MAPSKRDNDEERLTRIDALIEEYRRKHEDLLTYIEQATEKARAMREHARNQLIHARDRFSRKKTTS
jgi:hypothetical protein